MLASEWEWGGRGGGWGDSAVRPHAYQCRADTIPMVLADRWGVCVCVCVCVCLCVCWSSLSVNPRDRCWGMSSYLGAGAPPLPPFLLFCLVPSLPQEAYGESDWRDLGPPQGVLLSPVHLFQTGPCGTLGLPWGPCWLGIRPSKRLHFQVDCFVTVLGGRGGHPS